MPGDHNKTHNESPWHDNPNSRELDRNGIMFSGSSKQGIIGERLHHDLEEVVTVEARA